MGPLRMLVTTKKMNHHHDYLTRQSLPGEQMEQIEAESETIQ